jgi:hypothetical protein
VSLYAHNVVVKRSPKSATHVRWYRVQEFTCACTAIYYELIAHSGAYLIHKVTQLDTPVHAFAGPWPHAKARRWWSQLIVGDAR